MEKTGSVSLPAYTPPVAAAAERMVSALSQRVAGPQASAAARTLGFVDRLLAPWQRVTAAEGQAPLLRERPLDPQTWLFPRPWYELPAAAARSLRPELPAPAAASAPRPAAPALPETLAAQPQRTVSALAQQGAAIVIPPLAAAPEAAPARREAVAPGPLPVAVAAVSPAVAAPPTAPAPAAAEPAAAQPPVQASPGSPTSSPAPATAAPAPELTTALPTAPMAAPAAEPATVLPAAQGLTTAPAAAPQGTPLSIEAQAGLEGPARAAAPVGQAPPAWPTMAAPPASVPSASGAGAAPSGVAPAEVRVIDLLGPLPAAPPSTTAYAAAQGRVAPMIASAFGRALAHLYWADAQLRRSMDPRPLAEPTEAGLPVPAEAAPSFERAPVAVPAMPVLDLPAFARAAAERTARAQEPPGTASAPPVQRAVIPPAAPASAGAAPVVPAAAPVVLVPAAGSLAAPPAPPGTPTAPLFSAPATPAGLAAAGPAFVRYAEPLSLPGGAGLGSPTLFAARTAEGFATPLQLALAGAGATATATATAAAAAERTVGAAPVGTGSLGDTPAATSPLAAAPAGTGWTFPALGAASRSVELFLGNLLGWQIARDAQMLPVPTHRPFREALAFLGLPPAAVPAAPVSAALRSAPAVPAIGTAPREIFPAQPAPEVSLPLLTPAPARAAAGPQQAQLQFQASATGTSTATGTATAGAAAERASYAQPPAAWAQAPAAAVIAPAAPGAIGVRSELFGAVVGSRAAGLATEFVEPQTLMALSGAAMTPAQAAMAAGGALSGRRSLLPLLSQLYGFPEDLAQAPGGLHAPTGAAADVAAMPVVGVGPQAQPVRQAYAPAGPGLAPALAPSPARPSAAAAQAAMAAGAAPLWGFQPRLSIPGPSFSLAAPGAAPVLSAAAARGEALAAALPWPVLSLFPSAGRGLLPSAAVAAGAAPGHAGSPDASVPAAVPAAAAGAPAPIGWTPALADAPTSFGTLTLLSLVSQGLAPGAVLQGTGARTLSVPALDAPYVSLAPVARQLLAPATAAAPGTAARAPATAPAFVPSMSRAQAAVFQWAAAGWEPPPAVRAALSGTAASEQGVPMWETMTPVELPVVSQAFAGEGAPVGGRSTHSRAEEAAARRPELTMLQGGRTPQPAAAAPLWQRSAPEATLVTAPALAAAPAADSSARLLQAMRAHAAAQSTATDDRITLGDLTLIAMAAGQQQMAASPAGSSASPSEAAAPEHAGARGHAGGRGEPLITPKKVRAVARAILDEILQKLHSEDERFGEQ